MAHCQHMIFDWIVAQTGPVGLVIFAAGTLSAFYGFRMLRLLLAMYAGGLGCVAALIIGQYAPLPEAVLVPALGISGAAAALAWPGGATVVMNGVTWGVAGGYLATQFGLAGLPVWISAGLLGLMGTVLALISRDAMAVVLTSLYGAAWMIVGFAGLSAASMPTIGRTFQSWAVSQSLIVPILLLMLATTAYSFQANERRGDIRSGPRGSLRHIPEKTP